MESPLVLVDGLHHTHSPGTVITSAETITTAAKSAERYSSWSAQQGSVHRRSPFSGGPLMNALRPAVDPRLVPTLDSSARHRVASDDGSEVTAR